MYGMEQSLRLLTNPKDHRNKSQRTRRKRQAWLKNAADDRIFLITLITNAMGCGVTRSEGEVGAA